MEPQALFDVAFTRGCGTTLKKATASRRYRQLLASNCHEADPVWTTTAQLLGESLISAAARTLPESVRDIASQWQGATADSQLILLSMIYADLQYDAWSELHKPSKNERRKRQQATAVLPAEHGPWPSSEHRPSCIGMGTLLMAFASLTGAPHYFAQLMVDKNRAEWSLDLNYCNRVLESMERDFPTMAAVGELSRLRQRIWNAAIAIHDFDWYTFHTVLVIQIADGRWVMADPYLLSMSMMSASGWGLDQAILDMAAGGPKATVTIQNTAPYDGQFTLWLDELARIESFTRRTLDKFGDLPDEAFSVLVMAELVHRAVHKPLLNWLLDLRDDDWDTSHLAEDALYSWVAKENRNRRQGKALIARCEDDPQFARLCRERVLASPYRPWINDTIVQLGATRLVGPHVSVELQDPVMGVAISVLNNVRCFLNPRPIPIGGFLIHLTDAQSIWHDTMSEVIKRRHLDPFTASRLLEVEEKLRGLPEYSLHRLVRRKLRVLELGRQVADGTYWWQ